MRAWLSAVLATALVGGALGQTMKVPMAPGPTAPGPDAKATPGAATGHALDAADVEAFFDGVVPLQLERSDIAGATVLVMQDGKVLLEKGYGYADEKTKKPVDPVSTIFRLASISKLFTWVSVMQLEEQGKLNLDTDINQYLDFPIRPAFGKPITLRHLMTHSSGFEEQDRDVIITDPKKEPSLREYLIHNQPNRAAAPGVQTAYSNYGVGVAGYIVQRVSGQPFEQYVADHVFGPLGMVHSSFHQPVEAALGSLPSEGYWANTTKKPVGFEIFNPAPAGGLSSTAADMGRFGQALLNGGELDGHRILKPETLALMWTPQYRASPDMPPICMGFYEAWRDGIHWIGHQGDLIAFHSMFYVQPERKLTLFLSYNSAGSGPKVRPEILSMFTDRYFPGGVTPPVVSESRSELNEIAGYYTSTRRADSTRMRLSVPFNEAHVTVDKEGSLRFGDDSKDLRGHEMKWKPIAKDLWQEVDGQHRLFAIRDGSGKIVRIANDFPGSQFERLPWYETSAFVLPLLFGSVAILFAVVLASVWRTGRRLFLRGREKPAPQPGTVWLPLSTRIAAFVWIVPMIATALIVRSLGGDTMPPNSGWDKWFVLMNVVVGIALLLSLAPIVSGFRVWRRIDLRWITKVKFSLVAIACLVMIYVSIHYHQIGGVRI